MTPYSRVYAAINLDAVAANMEAMKANLPASTSMIGVVKTDGYGHGAVPVARTIDPYVDGYAVASVDEGIILRRHGIRKMVLVLGVTHESRFEDLVRYDIRPAMFRGGPKTVGRCSRHGEKGQYPSGSGHRHEPHRHETGPGIRGHGVKDQHAGGNPH